MICSPTICLPERFSNLAYAYGKSWRELSAALLFVLTILVLNATATAQTAGRIFFLNPTNGEYLIGGVDPSGYFHSTPAATRSTLAGTTHLEADNTALLAYNQFTGYSEFVVIDGFGSANFHPQQFNAGFSRVVGSGGDFFFYNGSGNSSGVGAIVALSQGGYFDRQLWSGGLSPWTNIVQSDDYLIFYNTLTGLFDETTLSPVYSALRQNRFSVQTLAKGYSVIAPVNDNVILYNSGTGAYRILGLYFAGNGNDFPATRGSGTLAKFYGAILPTVGRVVFYSYGSGDALVGHLTQTGQLVTEHKSTLPLYTVAFTTGSYVCLYDAVKGNFAVYSVSTGGSLTLHSSQNIGKGYTFTTATQF